METNKNFKKTKELITDWAINVVLKKIDPEHDPTINYRNVIYNGLINILKRNLIEITPKTKDLLKGLGLITHDNVITELGWEYVYLADKDSGEWGYKIKLTGNVNYDLFKKMGIDVIQINCSYDVVRIDHFLNKIGYKIFSNDEEIKDFMYDNLNQYLKHHFLVLNEDGWHIKSYSPKDSISISELISIIDHEIEIRDKHTKSFLDTEEETEEAEEEHLKYLMGQIMNYLKNGSNKLIDSININFNVDEKENNSLKNDVDVSYKSEIDTEEIPCYILRRDIDNFVFVTTNEQYANRVYNEKDEFVEMYQAVILNPKK